MWVDAGRVLTGAADDDVRLWSTAGAEVRSWPLRSGVGVPLPGGAALVVAPDGRLVRVTPDGAPAPLAQAPAGHFTSSPTGRVAALARGVALVLDPVAFTVAHQLPGEHLQVLALSADGALLAAGAGSGEVGWAYLWDLTADPPALRWRVEGLPGSARSLAFSPDGRWLLAGTSASQLVAIDVAQGVLAGAFFADARADSSLLGAHRAPVRAVAVAPGGRAVVSAATYSSRTASARATLELRTWDLERRTQRGLVEVEGELHGLRPSPDGRWLAVATRGDGACVRLLPVDEP
ncbi:MAG: hypothetical protein M9894_29070 [Planctomycetes bacterium]|nr:hypothetical protein [Planctomycetota bacterium]